jgi:phosphatidylglycerol:prolipoprotein diacylglycerol transferase
VLFKLSGRRVHSYPALLYIGLLMGTLAGCAVAPARGLASERFTVAELVLLVPALVGARLWFVAAHWQVYRPEPRRILRHSEGGMALYGGLLLAVACSALVLPMLGVGFGGFWDAATFTMLVGMVFVRLGCLLTGCCAGRPCWSRLALRLPDDRGRWQRRYPTQLLEAALAIALLAAAVGLLASGPALGIIFVFGLGGYGMGRFLLEPLRAPDPSQRWLPRPRLVSGSLVVISLLVGVAAWA